MPTRQWFLRDSHRLRTVTEASLIGRVLRWCDLQLTRTSGAKITSVQHPKTSSVEASMQKPMYVYTRRVQKHEARRAVMVLACSHRSIRCPRVQKYSGAPHCAVLISTKTGRKRDYGTARYLMNRTNPHNDTQYLERTNLIVGKAFLAPTVNTLGPQNVHLTKAPISFCTRNERFCLQYHPQIP